LKPDDDGSDRFGTWNAGDVKELDDLADRLLACGGPPCEGVAVPFGNDPARAARHVVGAFCRGLRDLAGGDADDRLAGEIPTPVVVPIPIDARPSRNAAEDAVVAGLRSWADLPPGSRAEDWPDEAHLRKLARIYADRLLLVVYGAESRSSARFEDLQAFAEALARGLPEGRRPRVVLIASDEHQRRFLTPHLQALAGGTRA
ncbi:MAG: hypothetical protein K2X91_15540, partial [Thermoleophilia bacterium]|nr:hypothetical protein [Thermoleophilia bacterium]